jgi:hypothetical protein
VLKNKHPAVSQGVRRFGKRSPPAADEHLQKPHNAGSGPEAQFFNTLTERRKIGSNTIRSEFNRSSDGIPVEEIP